MRKILYTSNDVRKAIIQLFSSSKKRHVAITAFVGDGAEDYIPKPKGLELYCWPKEGGTNPNALRELITRDVKVYCSKSLHMKVYWAEDQGAIITSANLSTNALGSGNLKEIGVLLEPSELDIDRIIMSLKAHPITKKDLLKLDRLHKSYLARNPVHTESTATSFSEWYESPLPPEWKLGWWDTKADVSLKAKEVLRNEFETTSAGDFVGARRGDYDKHDWILSFGLKSDIPRESHWMYADFIVRVPASEKVHSDDYPYEVVQIHRPRSYSAPPFRIDKRFRQAFSKAVQEFGAVRIREMRATKPSKELLDLIHDYY